MILGIGADIVDIRRIERLMGRFGQKAYDLIYTQAEQAAANRLRNSKIKMSFLAKRFAAKEAFSKACGTGFGKDVHFLDVDIINNNGGMPLIKISEKLEMFLRKKFNVPQIKIDLSLSDEYPIAQAFVVISEK